MYTNRMQHSHQTQGPLAAGAAASPSPPSTGSPAALGTIRSAFEKVRSIVNPTDARDFNSTTIEDVRKAALVIERQLAARQSLCNLRRLNNLFAGLDHYARVIEVLCNGTPFLPWVWAPIKLILQVRHPCLCYAIVAALCYSQLRRKIDDPSLLTRVVCVSLILPALTLYTNFCKDRFRRSSRI